MMGMGSVDMRELVKLQENLKNWRMKQNGSSSVKLVPKSLLPDYSDMLLSELR